MIPDVPSEPPQTVPTTSSSVAIGTVGIGVEPRALAATNARPSSIDLRVPPLRLNDDGVNRAAAFAHDLRQAVLVEALAAERNQQHRADVRMRAKPLHHRLAHKRWDSSRESR